MRSRCLVCKRFFEGVRKTGICSDKCREKRKNEKNQVQNEAHKALVFKPRKCPDCGKLTTDYRCPKCWNKRRAALGIPMTSESAGYSEYDV